MESIEQAIESLLNGNITHVRDWRIENQISITAMLSEYVYSYNPSRDQIVSFVMKLDYFEHRNQRTL